MEKNLQKGFVVYVIIAIIAIVFVFGVMWYYYTNQPKNQKEVIEKKENDIFMENRVGETPVKKDEGAMIEKYTGSLLAGISSPLLDYNKADYDAAFASDKLVVLYFYANWCPICKAEVSDALYPAFNELTTDKAVGFRVNYNDNQTDNDEKNLAREFGVAYQHTKVFVKNGERILKSPESWSKSRYLEEINKNL